MLATRKAFFDMAISLHTQGVDDDMESRDGDKEDKVDKILGHRGEGGEGEYHIYRIAVV